jgi:hypothetical protein
MGLLNGNWLEGILNIFPDKNKGNRAKWKISTNIISFDSGQPWCIIKMLKFRAMQGRERCLKPSLQREQVLFIRNKHSQQFSPGTKLLATKSWRKNLFVVDENEHARERDAANIGRGPLCEKVLRKAISWQPPWE